MLTRAGTLLYNRHEDLYVPCYRPLGNVTGLVWSPHQFSVLSSGDCRAADAVHIIGDCTERHREIVRPRSDPTERNCSVLVRGRPPHPCGCPPRIGVRGGLCAGMTVLYLSRVLTKTGTLATEDSPLTGVCSHTYNGDAPARCDHPRPNPPRRFAPDPANRRLHYASYLPGWMHSDERGAAMPADAGDACKQPPEGGGPWPRYDRTG